MKNIGDNVFPYVYHRLAWSLVEEVIWKKCPEHLQTRLYRHQSFLKTEAEKAFFPIHDGIISRFPHE